MAAKTWILLAVLFFAVMDFQVATVTGVGLNENCSQTGICMTWCNPSVREKKNQHFCDSPYFCCTLVGK